LVANGYVQSEETEINGYLDIITPYVRSLKNAIDEKANYALGIGVEIISESNIYNLQTAPHINAEYPNVQMPMDYKSEVEILILGYSFIHIPTEDKLITPTEYLPEDGIHTPSINRILEDVKLLLSGWKPAHWSGYLTWDKSNPYIPIPEYNSAFGMVAFGATYKTVITANDQFTYETVKPSPRITTYPLSINEELP
jgi:hypothetical protein